MRCLKANTRPKFNILSKKKLSEKKKPSRKAKTWINQQDANLYHLNCLLIHMLDFHDVFFFRIMFFTL